MKLSQENVQELKNDDSMDITTYMFFNETSGKFYIGSTGDTSRRLRDHLRELKNGTHSNKRFQNAFNENPNFEFLPVPLTSREEALVFEDELIKENWNNPNLLNIAYIAEAAQLGAIVSQETIEKKSQAMLRFYANGGQNPMQGQKHTEDIKQKLSTLAKIQFSDPDKIEIARNNTLNNWKDPSYREKHSIGQRKAFDNSEVKQNTINSAINRWSNSDEREKQSQMAIKRFSDLEQRKHLSEISKKQWQNSDMKEIICQKVNIGNNIYESMTAAAIAFNCSITTIFNRLKSDDPKWKDWFRLD